MTTEHLRSLAALTAATAALSTLLLPTASCRAAASFSLSDGVGDTTSGSYTAGSSFTLAVTFTSTVATPGYSLWFDTATANANRFSIGSFTLTSASFPAGSGGTMGAQTFNTANAGRTGFLSNQFDLGATSNGGNTVPAGSYVVENVTFLIDPAAPVGTTYTFQTTPAASGGRASGGVNPDFSFTAAPSATYTFTVVPEPTTWALLGVGAVVWAGSRQLRRRA